MGSRSHRVCWLAMRRYSPLLDPTRDSTAMKIWQVPTTTGTPRARWRITAGPFKFLRMRLAGMDLRGIRRVASSLGIKAVLKKVCHWLIFERTRGQGCLARCHALRLRDMGVGLAACRGIGQRSSTARALAKRGCDGPGARSRQTSHDGARDIRKGGVDAELGGQVPQGR